MKSKRLFLYGALLSTSFLCNGMNELVKKEIDKVEQIFKQQSKKLSFDTCMQLGLFDARHDGFAQVVYKFGHLMTDTEKLDYLLGDNRFEERKKIIIGMIEEKKIDPNIVLYQKQETKKGRTPLFDSVECNRVDFAKYLLAKGATSNKEMLEYIDFFELSKFKELLQKS